MFDELPSTNSIYSVSYGKTCGLFLIKQASFGPPVMIHCVCVGGVFAKA